MKNINWKKFIIMTIFMMINMIISCAPIGFMAVCAQAFAWRYGYIPSLIWFIPCTIVWYKWLQSRCTKYVNNIVDCTDDENNKKEG